MKHKLKPKGSILAALDIGSHKIACFIGHSPRHCERSEAIQSGWPRRLQLLAMTIILTTLVFFVFSNNASACMETKSLRGRINSADIIFEGHLVKYEKHDLVRKNGSVEPSLVRVFIVDKNLKGAKTGAEIRFIQGGTFSYGELVVPEKIEKPIEGIVILSRRVQTKDGDFILYIGDMCPSELFSSPSKIKEIKSMLVMPVQFWPFWAYYSLKRWVEKLT